MNPNNYASLEASKRLHDAGIVLETDAVWARDENGWYLRSSFENTDREVLESCPAPSMTEVWRELPATVPDRGLSMKLRKAGDGKTWGSYFRDGSQIIDSIKADTNPTDALIDLLIWVRKEASHET